MAGSILTLTQSVVTMGIFLLGTFRKGKGEDIVCALCKDEDSVNEYSVLKVEEVSSFLF